MFIKSSIFRALVTMAGVVPENGADNIVLEAADANAVEIGNGGINAGGEDQPPGDNIPPVVNIPPVEEGEAPNKAKASAQKELEDIKAVLKVLTGQALETKRAGRKAKIASTTGLIKSAAGKGSVS